MLTSAMPSTIKHGWTVERVGTSVVGGWVTAMKAMRSRKIRVRLTWRETSDDIECYVLRAFAISGLSDGDDDFENIVHFVIIRKLWVTA